MPPVPRSRLFAACLALLAVLAGCSQEGSPATDETVDASSVNQALADVAAARAAVADRVDAELRAAVRVEPLAVALRSPSGIDASLEEVPGVVGLFDAADPADSSAALDELDVALDAAGAAIESTLAGSEAGSWQERFLAAQADVVRTLGAWSTASRNAHAVALEHWELWQGVVDEAAVLHEERWRYRSPEEAAGTWEIEVGDDLAPLGAAAAAVTEVAAARDEAAGAVAAADEHAAAVFADRPAEQS